MEKNNKNNGSNNNNKNKPKSKVKIYRKLNVFLTIMIIVAMVILAFRINDIFPDWGDDGDTIDPPPPRKIGNKSIIPSREAGIINGHEHIQRVTLGPLWIEAMNRSGISTTIMVGSPDATFWLNPKGPFEEYKKYNEELFKLVDKYPDRFIAFPTIDNREPGEDNVELIKNYTSRGALGLKLYSGHFASFHTTLGPLNRSNMDPVYEYCENQSIPIIWHVHLGQIHIQDEFEDVMARYPNLIVNIPHFMLSSTNLWHNNGQGRLRHYLETYPNLYTDISFGYWVRDGIWRISNHTKIFNDFITEFQDRFTYGTDMVATIHPRKTVEWVTNSTLIYRYVLEKEFFNITMKVDIEGDFNGDNPGNFNGMNMSRDVLDKIYYDNIVKFLNGKNYTWNLEDVIAQSNLTYENSASTRSPCEYSDYRSIGESIFIAEAREDDLLLMG